MLSLLAKTMAKLITRMYAFCGLFSIKKQTNEQRVRQQDMCAARGDVTQFRHPEMRWEGLIMFSK